MKYGWQIAARNLLGAFSLSAIIGALPLSTPTLSATAGHDDPAPGQRAAEENAMSNEQDEVELIEMKCPYLVKFQSDLRREFLKPPHSLNVSQELVASFRKYPLSEIKDFLACFEAVEAGKEFDEKDNKDLDFIYANTPFAWAFEKSNPDRKIQLQLRVYITFKDNKIYHANIMINF